VTISLRGKGAVMELAHQDSY